MNEVPVATGSALRGPFRGQAMNCRQCHLSDDFIRVLPLAGRTCCDFSRRSLIPFRKDGAITTVRNTPLMPDLELPRDGPSLFHFDGEFVTIEDLVVATMPGRNFGWLPTEASVARYIERLSGRMRRESTNSHQPDGTRYIVSKRVARDGPCHSKRPSSPRKVPLRGHICF